MIHEQWFALVKPHGAPEPVIVRELHDVVARYREPHRHHHTLQHIQDVLRTVDLLLQQHAAQTHPLDDEATSALKFAAWLHDVIYDPQGHDNEAASARDARGRLARLQVAPAIIEQTARLIELTASHSVPGDDLPGQVLIDADLAILGADSDAYERYAAGIRAEYAHLDEGTYRAGRAEVLQRFLDRPVLFNTEVAREHFEVGARRNLRHELDRLRAPAPEAIS